MQNSSTNLLNLEKIYTPESVSAFPLAYGWYLLAVLVIIGLVLLIWVGWTWNRRTKVRRAAQKQLKLSHKQFLKDQNEQAYIKRHLMIIKQICALKYPQALPLSGQALGGFLNQGKPVFNDDSLFALTQGLYQKPQTLVLNKLHAQCKQWIRRYA